MCLCLQTLCRHADIVYCTCAVDNVADVFGECYSNSEDRAYALLVRRTQCWSKSTVLNLATEADAKSFFAHDGVQVPITVNTFQNIQYIQPFQTFAKLQFSVQLFWQYGAIKERDMVDYVTFVLKYLCLIKKPLSGDMPAYFKVMLYATLHQKSPKRQPYHCYH